MVSLLHATPLSLADKAIGKCWDKVSEKPEERMYRVGNKFKHASTLEHVNYTFDIDGVSRALLQELARHRMASISVKSTRYTLKELKESDDFDSFLVKTGTPDVDNANIHQLRELKYVLEQGVSNDKVKYMLPEAYKTSCVWTINMRSLQNFLSLRTDKSALWEIQDLAHAVYEEIPEEHKFMLQEFVKERV
jgi:thymidylate synthase (FAD)